MSNVNENDDRLRGYCRSHRGTYPRICILGRRFSRGNAPGCRYGYAHDTLFSVVHQMGGAASPWNAVKRPGELITRLLRARRERPHGRRAGEERGEFAALHSITSSAMASSLSGIWRPSALAVVRLMTRSNLVGCSTGMSPGFVPRRILST